MARVIYRGNLLEPVQLAPITKRYDTTGDGEKVGSIYQISLQGTLVSFKGSPQSSGNFHTTSGRPNDEALTNDENFESLIQKQEAIRELFSVDGGQLELAPLTGASPLKCNPRILSVQFQEGTWYNLCRYTIELEADVLYIDGSVLGEDSFSPLISSASETWSFETDDQPEDHVLPRTYRVSHTVTAIGKRFFDDTGSLTKNAWKQAQEWVLPRLGFDSTIALSSGVNNLPDYYQALDHIRNEQTDKKGGEFSVTETWILASGTARETFDIQEVISEQEGYTSVTVQGTINGFEQRDSNFNITSTKWENADSKWSGVKPNILNRAQAYTGLSLNPQVLTSTVGRNPVTGSITYSYEYDNRPTNLITDTKSEVIHIGGDFGRDVIARVGVLGRGLGPVLQSLNTKQETTRNLTVELFFKNSYLPSGTISERLKDNHPRNRSPQSGELQELVNAAHPVLAGALNNLGQAASDSYVVDQNENWDISNLHYSYNVSWVYE